MRIPKTHTLVERSYFNYIISKNHELEKENEKLKKRITELKVRLLDTREARDNATKVANTYLDQNADISKTIELLQEQLDELQNDNNNLCNDIIDLNLTIKNKEKQLNEANEVIKKYSDDENWCDYYDEDDEKMTKSLYIECDGPLEAKVYLEKWGAK